MRILYHAKKISKSLKLTFDDIANADILVGDASDVADWNTFFDLPTNGTPFTSVTIEGNVVKLYGGSGITIKTNMFYSGEFEHYDHLLKIEDYAGCIVKINAGGFSNLYFLTDLYLPECTETGGYRGAIEGCRVLLNLYMPKLTTVGDYTFEGCLALTDLSGLPINSYTALGDSIFSNCISLQSSTLIFPNLISAGMSCFGYCDGLISITDTNFPALTTAGYMCFYRNSSLVTVNLTNLYNVGQYCFCANPVLESISLPALVTGPSEGLVDGCPLLTSAYLPNVEWLGNGAFQQCPSMVVFNFPKLKHIDNQCFYTCYAADTFNFPALEEIMGVSVFSSCNATQTMYFPSLIKIGNSTGNDYAFSGLSGATITLTIPHAIETDADIVYLKANNTVTVVYSD